MIRDGNQFLKRIMLKLKIAPFGYAYAAP